MVVSVSERQLVEDVILGADGVGLVSAGRAVVPGEGDGGHTVVVIYGQNEPVLHHMLDHGGHLRLPVLGVLQPEVLAQVGPVGETPVEVLVRERVLSNPKIAKTCSDK